MAFPCPVPCVLPCSPIWSAPCCLLLLPSAVLSSTVSPGLLYTVLPLLLSCVLSLVCLSRALPGLLLYPFLWSPPSHPSLLSLPSPLTDTLNHGGTVDALLVLRGANSDKPINHSSINSQYRWIQIAHSCLSIHNHSIVTTD